MTLALSGLNSTPLALLALILAVLAFCIVAWQFRRERIQNGHQIAARKKREREYEERHPPL